MTARPGHGPLQGEAGTLPREDASPVPLAWLAMAGLAVVLALSPAYAQEAAPAPVAPSPTAKAVQEALHPQKVPPEPDGYRMDEYRAPTPATLRGAKVIDTDAAAKLWRDKAALFVDVMPRDARPANLPPGTIWRDKKRDDIPGSVWLPNVGYGVLNAQMDGYFRGGLQSVTDGRHAAPLVFYCQTDCWMSWNAAKRALEYGFSNVSWYPGGSDGWTKAGLPLEAAVPRL
ncbi:MAG: Rhodanese domain protein [Xanthobacteraceae bacterium]|jgi:PQQ-dependent catabolism-associated CXXCW motif protein|nr:Rhodanese domain protein [Xanthobacteraceae bacterium]